MVSKLKKLSEDDLADISDYFSNLIYKKINYTVDSPKEIINMDERCRKIRENRS